MELAVAFALTRPETTGVVTRGVARLFEALGYAALLEVPLPNGRRADLMGLGPRGEIVIAEVKSSLEDYRCDRKWGDYGPFCDAFYFAVPPEFPQAVLPEEPGLICARGFGGPDQRPPEALRAEHARRPR